MKEEILNFISTMDKKWATRYIRNNSEWVSYLDSCFPSRPLPEQIRFLRSGYIKIPGCLYCGTPVNFAHSKTCSKSCRDKYQKENGLVFKRLQKAKKTNLKKYGVENPAQNAEVQKRRLQTMNKIHGGNVSKKSLKLIKKRTKDFIKKGRLTLQKKYNVINPGQLPDHRAKCIKTTKNKYGVDHYYKSDYWKERSLINQLKNYQILCDNVEIQKILCPSNKKIQIYKNPNMIISFVCLNCNTSQNITSETFKYRIKNFTTPCKTCSNIKNSSNEQYNLEQFIKNLVPNITVNDRSIIHPLELDIVIPEYKIAIEYCGLFWHNDMRIDKQYHLNKQIKCNQQGYKLITIFQDEWIHKTDIVKSRLQNLFQQSTKLYARNCKIQEISAKEANVFLNQNHIQGVGRSNVRLGAFYQNELIGVMTFSKPNIAKGNPKYAYELNRFCTKLNTSVVGLGSKLFTNFVKLYSPDNVISYADRRWSTNAFYTNLGFKECGITSINYWYIKGNTRIHRFALRKNKQDDQSLTEYENRKNQGWNRIWDCGSIKFVWNKK